MKILIALILLSQLMVYPVGLNFRWSKEIMSVVGIIILLAHVIWKYNKQLAIFLLWSVVVFAFHKAIIVPENTSGKHFGSFFAIANMVNIILFSLFYYILRVINLDKRMIYKVICITAIAHTLYIFLQVLDLDQFFFHLGYFVEPHIKYSVPVGFWGNETLAGWGLAITSPFFLYFDKLRYRIGYAAVGLATCLTGSTTAICAFFIGFIILSIRNSKVVPMILITILLGCGIFGYKAGKLDPYLDDTKRFEVWGKTIKVWKASRQMITGRGHGSYRVFYKNIPEHTEAQGVWAQAHNDYLQILYEQGVVGLSIVIWFIYMFVMRIRRHNLIPATSIILFGLIMANGFPLHTAIAVIPVISLAIFEKESQAYFINNAKVNL